MDFFSIEFDESGELLISRYASMLTPRIRNKIMSNAKLIVTQVKQVIKKYTVLCFES